LDKSKIKGYGLDRKGHGNTENDHMLNPNPSSLCGWLKVQALVCMIRLLVKIRLALRLAKSVRSLADFDFE